MHLTSIDDAAWASPWRRRQVGEKLALSMALVLTALVGPPWPTTVLVAMVSLVAVLGFARIPARVLATAMAAPVVFIAVSALSVAVSLGSPQQQSAMWWHWGPVGIGRESVLLAAGLVGHAVAGALAIMVLATTTPMVDLLAWAQRMRLPAPLVEVAALTYRLLFVLLASTLAVREAQQSRLGESPIGRGSLRRRLDASGRAMGSILVRSWSQARRLEDGLAGRGYESCLLTLPVARPASAPLRWGTAAAIMGIWLVVWGVSR